MRTGEGKTLVATFPAYLNALTGKGVHVVTVNDYLAKRDAGWMGKVYAALGMTTGVVYPFQSDAEKRAAYAADITYATNNELGFDYLRDNMKGSLDEMAQRGHYFAIVDEVDSILVDEARTPLIISGPAQDRSDAVQYARQIHPRASARALQARRKDPQRHLHRGWQRISRKAACKRSASCRPTRRSMTRNRRPSSTMSRRPCGPTSCSPARPALYRARWRGDADRRIHRPHDEGPPPVGRPASGDRGQGKRASRSSPRM